MSGSGFERPRQVLVAAAYGVRELLARVGPLGRGQRLATGTPAGREVADRLGDHADRAALLLARSPCPTGAPCPGTTTLPAVSRPITRSRVAGHSIG